MQLVRHQIQHLLVVAILLLGLALTSLYSYLLFHTLAEVFSVGVGIGVFIVAWNARQWIANTYLLFIGIGFVFISIIDVVHTLAFKGIGIFREYDANLPTQLWVAARYLQSVSLLIAPLFLRRRLPGSFILAGYSIVTIVLLGVIFGNLFPVCYIEGAGLTPFKIVSEYIICAIFTASIFVLIRQRRHFDHGILNLLIFATIASIGSEIAFTSYLGVYDLANLVGHLFKVIAFYLIYLSLIESGLQRPYDSLFRSLKQSEESFARSNAYFRALTENAHDLITVVNADGTVRYCSPSMQRLLGDTVAEITNQNMLDWMHPDDRVTLTRTFTASLENPNQVTHFQVRICRKDSDWAVIEGTICNLLANPAVEGLVINSRDITARKKADQVISNLAKFPTENPNPVLRLNLEGVILYANLASQGLLAEWQSVVGKYAPPLVCDLVSQAFKNSSRTTTEIVCGERIFLFYITPVVEGGYANFYGHDITERKRAAEALRESEERFRLAFENSNIGMAMIDLSWRFLRVNHRLGEILGYSENELMALKVNDVTHPDDMDTSPLFGRRALAGEIEHDEFEKRYIHRQGQIVWVRVASSLVRDARGAPLYFFSHVQDITAYKQVGLRLRQLSRAVEQSPASIVITDTDGTIEYVNPKFTQITGYTFEEALGKNPRILKSGEMAQETYTELWNTILAGKEWHGEFHNKKKNGERYWESASISPIADVSGKITHFVAVREDITARKQAERQLYYLSTHDALTGLYNRMHFEAELARLEYSRAFPVSVIVADADNMKGINDSRGHAAGDELLRRATAVFHQVFRASDIIARVGGDEFAILLPATDAFTAEQILMRIHEKLVEYRATTTDLPLDLSLGVATTVDDHLEETLKLADQRMYADKRAHKQSVNTR